MCGPARRSTVRFLASALVLLGGCGASIPGALGPADRIALSANVCTYGGLRPVAFVGERPSALVLADVDVDGRVDAVVARPDAHAIAVARGRGDGTFTDGASIRVEGLPVALAAGDINGDRVPDVAVLEGGLPRVSVFASGPGGLRLVGGATLMGPPPPRHALAVGDLDGDGLADVVVGDANARVVAVLRAIGGGALAPPRAVFVGPDVPRAITLGDYNGDRTLDIAVAFNQEVTILSGDGRGAFSPTTRHPTFEPLALAPFPAAGRHGLVISRDGGDLRIVGLGTFAGVAREGDGRWRSASLLVADIDGDGAGDLLEASPAGQELSVVRVDPSKLAPPPVVVPRAGKRPDLDAPSLSTSSPPEVPIARDEVRLGAGEVPIAVAAADLNADGAVDAVTVDRDGMLGATMNANLLRRDGPAALPRTVPIARYAQGAFVADVDGDADPDVVVLSTNTPGEQISALLRRGEGLMPVRTPVRGRHVAFSVFDADGDGRQDFVSLLRGKTDSLVLHRGSGDGRFDAAGVTFPLGTNSWIAKYADLDGDGAIDAIFGTQSGDVFMMKNLRSAFAAPLRLGHAGHEIESIAIDDLDGDRRPDVVATGPDASRTGRAAIFWAGLPGTPTLVPAPKSVTTGHLGRRPFVDLVATSGSPSIVRNEGGRVLRPVDDAAAWDVPDGLTVDDADGDGSGDVLFGKAGDLLVRRGRDDGSLEPALRYRVLPTLDVDYRPFVMTTTTGTQLSAIHVLRGARGQAPALVITSNASVSILPRACWRVGP